MTGLKNIGHTHVKRKIDDSLHPEVRCDASVKLLSPFGVCPECSHSVCVLYDP